MERISEILAPYFGRIERRHGLTRNMNKSLRSFPIIPEMVRRTVQLLLETEQLFGMPGTVRMTRLAMYRTLIATEDAWVKEVPALCDGQARFVRKPRYPFHMFTEAMTVARHVGLIAGHGRNGLHPDLLKALRRAPAAGSNQLSATRNGMFGG